MNFPVDGMTVEIISEDGIPVVTEKSAKFDRSKPPFQTGS
jgi:hypothetical protein